MVTFDKKPFFIFVPVFAALVLVALFTIRLSDSSGSLGNGLSLAKNIPIPTVVQVQAKTDTTEVHSPDGSMKIVVKKTFNTQTLANYTVSVSEVSATFEKIIFSKNLGENQAIQIPDNSWSPDNKYLFLKENDNGKLSFFVLKATGGVFSDGKEYIDVVPLFEDKKYGFRLSDITGWDSNSLLHVFTVSENDTKGPSFWFDVESKNFSVLGRR